MRQQALAARVSALSACTRAWWRHAHRGAGDRPGHRVLGQPPLALPSRLHAKSQALPWGPGAVRSISAGRLLRGRDEEPGTFVSEHYRIGASEVEKLADRNGWTIKRMGAWVQVELCPHAVCKGTDEQQRTKDQGNNFYTFGVHAEQGSYNCFRCGASGSWVSLKKALSGNEYDIAKPQVSSAAPRPPSASSAGGPPRQAKAVEQTHAEIAARLDTYADTLGASIDALLAEEEGGGSDGGGAQIPPLCNSVVTWLRDERQISPETLKAYRVGAAQASFDRVPHHCATFPWYTDQAEGPVRVKVRAHDDKKCMRLEPSGAGWGFFGWNLVEEGDEEVVITEGELDALTVYQETGRKALSLPNGARSLPPELIRMLERFKRVYLWLDDDVPGQQGAAAFARKLGLSRCLIVQTREGSGHGPKDANDALRELCKIREEQAVKLDAIGLDEEKAEELIKTHLLAEDRYDLEGMIERAEVAKHSNIIRFSDLKTQVRQILSDHVEAAGINFGGSLKTLNKILKGHRPGELTLLTGRTGQGKTTMVSQISLELCAQGVHTLWGSFEVQNYQLAAKMLQQHAGQSLKGCSDDQFNKAAGSFEEMPLYFLTFYGSTQLESVMDAMEYAAYAYDVRHVVLDNLQFMTSGMARRGADMFQLLDESIHQIRQFCSDKNVHVTLVVHPRKEDDGKLLTMSSFYGSGKATQESDNVIILQDNGVYRFLDVKKNRYDGVLGTVPFDFDPGAMRFNEMSAQDIRDLRKRMMQQEQQGGQGDGN